MGNVGIGYRQYVKNYGKKQYIKQNHQACFAWIGFKKAEAF